jgi:hypothetical protein
MSVGFSYLSSTIASDEIVGDFSVNGSGLGLDFLLGGTLTPGLVLGGGLLVNAATRPNVEIGDFNREVEGGASLAMLALFVDGFIDPEGGFHVGGALGLAGFSIDEDDDPTTENVSQEFAGFGLSAWAGYGGWIGENWQMGGMVRLSAARTENEPGTATASTQAFTVLFTALHH